MKNHTTQNRKSTPLTASILPLLFVSTAFATDYNTNGGDAANPLTWTPDPTSIISGTVITPLVGDRLIMNDGDLNNESHTIRILAGAELDQAVATRHVRAHLELAGTGTDGNGALQNKGTDWVRLTHVKLTDDAKINVGNGGYRHEPFGTASNQFDMNGKTLSVVGNSNFYWVNTNVFGGGVINADIRGEFNFEAASVLPAGITLNLNNTRHGSWDGAGQTMVGDVTMSNSSIIEVRNNDLNKTYTGTITLNAGQQMFRTSPDGNGIGSLNIAGKVTGIGELVKDGNMVVDLGTGRGSVTLNNANNDYSGGTRVESGVLRIGVQGGLAAGPLKMNGGQLDLNGTIAPMTSGLLKGGVVRDGILSMEGTGVKEIQPGASVTAPVELREGVLKPNHNTGSNILGNALTNQLLVAGDATLKPYQDPPIAAQADRLHQFHRVGADLNTDDGTTNAIYAGTDDGIPAIDSTAKPYLDNNKFVYTGELINTTGGNLSVAFAEQYDDQVRVKVDGTTVLFDTAWNVATASGNGGQPGLVNLTPGTHTIEISSFDGVGGAGPNSGWDKGVGIRIGGYTLLDPDGDGGGGATAGSTADNAAFTKITSANLAGLGLAINAPTIDLTADRSENKNFEIDAGVALTVDTTDMQGRKYSMTGTIIGGGGLTKSGSGVLALTAANSHSGPTKVSQGTLRLENVDALEQSESIQVDGILDTTALANWTVNPGQVIKGSGSLNGALITLAGTAAPGNSIGTLTISGNLTATGASVFEMELGVPGVSDFLGVSGTFDLGGSTLTVLGSGPFNDGDSWDLFSAAIASGTFGAFNLPVLGGGLLWDTSATSTTGVIAIVPEVSSGLLMLLGGLGFTLRRRRR